MANSIALFKKYIDLLDEVYKDASKTSELDGDATLVRAGANANEIIIPKMTMDGLGDYSRNGGYAQGDVSLTHETVQFNYDRGRKFDVDAMDNEETAGVAFGKLSSEFIRTKVAPEQDAFNFAIYASKAGNSANGTLSAGADVMSAIGTAVSTMDEKEVPMEGRILFITPTNLNAVKALDTTKSRELLQGFSKIVSVPQGRFYTAIDMLDGSTQGEEDGGYAKAVDVYAKTTDTALVEGKTYYTKSGTTYTAVVSPDVDDIDDYYEKLQSAGVDINFMIIHPSAVIQYPKHVVNKVISPEENQDKDAWKFFFRSYGLADVYENKVDGIYVHHK